jgi:alpha-galactosidase
MLRSGMMGWFTIMLDTSVWSAEQHAAAKQEIDLYKKELRPLIRDASLYHVSARPDGVHWDGTEYWDADRRKGVLYAFHGTNADEKTHSFPLKGLEPRARYRLIFHDHSALDRVIDGKELMGAGLKVSLPSPNSSELIFIEGSDPQLAIHSNSENVQR